MSAVNDYLARVRFHQQHCEWHKIGKMVNGKYVMDKPPEGTRILFRLTSGEAFFGRMSGDTWIDTWEITPGQFADVYDWCEVEEWCLETEDHPGIPVVRTY